MELESSSNTYASKVYIMIWWKPPQGIIFYGQENTFLAKEYTFSG